MATSYNLKLVTDGLVYYLDAANPRCYAGTGLTSYGLVGSIVGSLAGSVGFGTSNNGSFIFNDTSDHISLGNPTVLQGLQLNMTLSCWFNQRSNVSYGTLYSDYSAVGAHKLVSLLRVDSGQLRYFTSDSAGNYQYVQPASITNGSWYFVSVTISGILGAPVATIFLNGTTYSYNLVPLSSTPFTGSTHCIGGNVHNNEYFDGNIALTQIYNRALSAAEVRQNYNATKGRYGL